MSSLETGSSFDASQDVKGNPHYIDESSEAPKLAEEQLKQRLETAAHELAQAQDKLESAKSDEMISPDAAQALFDSAEEQFNDLQSEWTEKYGHAETSH